MQDRRRSHSTASPSAWTSYGSLNATNASHLEVEGERVRYKGPGTTDKDAASVRANHAVPFGAGIYYFEIEVVDKGRNGYVGIGFSAPTVPLNRLPGWEPAAYGYHGDDGCIFYESGKGQQYGPTFGKGDIIGALLNRAERTISFTKNGIDLGIAFRNVHEDSLYPTVGLRTPDEEIIANFGSRPFKASFGSMQQEVKQRVTRSIDEQDVSQWLKESSHGSLEEMIMGYLVENGHWKTAKAAASCIGSQFPNLDDKSIEEIKRRQEVQELIMAGDCQTASKVIDSIDPKLQHERPELAFKLSLAIFMQMIASGNHAEAIQYGRKILAPVANSSDDKKSKLEEALTLLTSPLATDSPNYQALLGQQARIRLSKEANAELLRAQGRPGTSLIERGLKQVEATIKELHRSGCPRTAMVDVNEYLNVKSKSN